ncbi:hypothetical protein D4R78_08585 [bacterium]|nr:MAG: hypothetical protein D4R78_08585 [bacterium]
MIEADLQLKKDTAKATSPQTPEGKEYWDKLYKKAGAIFGYDNVAIPTLTRPWIVPDEIIIRESADSAYVYKATLKVMLEQDYLKDSAVYNFEDNRLKQLNEYSSQLIRELIIPKLTKEINTSKRYASLRQVYYSLILAQWFKARYANKDTTYSRLINRKDLTNLFSKESWSKSAYFQAYQKSFKDGEYNISEPVSTPYGQTIRSYFSGGISGFMSQPQVVQELARPIGDADNKAVLPATGKEVIKGEYLLESDVDGNTDRVEINNVDLSRQEVEFSAQEQQLQLPRGTSSPIQEFFTTAEQEKGTSKKDLKEIMQEANDFEDLEEGFKTLGLYELALKIGLLKNRNAKEGFVNFIMKVWEDVVHESASEYEINSSPDILSGIVITAEDGTKFYLHGLVHGFGRIMEEEVLKFVGELEKNNMTLLSEEGLQKVYGYTYGRETDDIKILLSSMGMDAIKYGIKTMFQGLQAIVLKLVIKILPKSLIDNSSNMSRFSSYLKVKTPSDLAEVRKIVASAYLPLPLQISAYRYIHGYPSSIDESITVAKRSAIMAIRILQEYSAQLEKYNLSPRQTNRVEEIHLLCGFGHEEQVAFFLTHPQWIGRLLGGSINLEVGKLRSALNQPSADPQDVLPANKIASSSPVIANILKRISDKLAVKTLVREVLLNANLIAQVRIMVGNKEKNMYFVEMHNQIHHFGFAAAATYGENDVIIDLLSIKEEVRIMKEECRSNTLFPERVELFESIFGEKTDPQIFRMQLKETIAHELMHTFPRKELTLADFSGSEYLSKLKPDTELLQRIARELASYLVQIALSEKPRALLIHMGDLSSSRKKDSPNHIYAAGVIIELLIKQVGGFREYLIAQRMQEREIKDKGSITKEKIEETKKVAQQLVREYPDLNDEPFNSIYIPHIRFIGTLQDEEIRLAAKQLFERLFGFFPNIDIKLPQAIEEYVSRVNLQSDSPVVSAGQSPSSSPIVRKEEFSITASLEISNKGGIDFRTLPIVTQAMNNLSLNASRIPLSRLESINLDQELRDIQKMIETGITPSTDRIKDYVQVSCLKGELNDMQKVIYCIADILRAEEESCSSTESTLKDILVVFESGRSNQ